MLDGFAAHTHGLRVLIEPRLRGLDKGFVFPAFDAALVGRCALILERSCAARLGQVNPHFLAIFISGETALNLLPTTATLAFASSHNSTNPAQTFFMAQPFTLAE